MRETLRDDSFTEVLLEFHSVKLLCLKNFGHKGSIIIESKGYDLWHNIHKL